MKNFSFVQSEPFSSANITKYTYIDGKFYYIYIEDGRWNAAFIKMNLEIENDELVLKVASPKKLNLKVGTQFLSM